MRRSVQRRTFSVVLIGPDGSGKTTIARSLVDRRDLPFAERQLVRWTFQILPRLEPIVDWWERHIYRIPLPDAAHDGMRSTLPIWQSLAITAYYAIDMCLGRMVLWRARRQSRMFLFDRSFFDYYILMGHRRLPPWYLRLLSRLVPAPDLLLYIKRDAASIYRDKPELTAGEITRQQTILE
jgi:thymidylate kinase